MSCYANTKDPEEIKRQKVEPILELGRFLGGIHCVSRAFLKLCQFEATVSALGKKNYFFNQYTRKGYELVLLSFNRPLHSCVLSHLAMNASEAGGVLALIQKRLSSKFTNLLLFFTSYKISTHRH